MKKERQLPLSFNNDKDVKRIRDFLKTAPAKDFNLMQTMIDHEFSYRKKHTFQEKKEETKEAMAGFLDKVSFDYFCTFTTRKPVSMFATRRIAEKVCEHVDAGNSSSVFWAAEEFDVRDGFHFHALMKMDDQPRQILTANGSYSNYQPYGKMELFDWYFRKYGRCDIIDNRDPSRQLAASYYVSKYVTKRITDYDFRISKFHLR